MTRARIAAIAAHTVAVALAASVGLALVGCGLDMTAAGPWRPAADMVAPLAVEQLAPPASAVAGLAAAPAPMTIRVVTYNVNTGWDPAELAATISGDPDLAGAALIQLQEEESYPDQGASWASQLAGLLGLGYVYVPARLKTDVTHGIGTHGLALLSPYPITNLQKMDLARTETGIQRIAISEDLLVGDRVLHAIDVHLETRLNPDERVEQLHPVVIDAPDRVLVSGDFNTNGLAWAGGTVPIVPDTAASSDQAPILDDYMRALGFATPSAGSGPTETMYGLEFRLDSFYTRGLDVQFGKVDRIGPSDHWPMWIDVTLPD